jgi:two-component system cell cycle sensor histidine kinase/response regulator CckA
VAIYLAKTNVRVFGSGIGQTYPWLVLVGVSIFVSIIAPLPASLSIGLLAFAATVGLTLAVTEVVDWNSKRNFQNDLDIIKGWLDVDTVPVLVTDWSGQVVAVNRLAEEDPLVQANSHIRSALSKAVADACDLLNAFRVSSLPSLRHEFQASKGAVEVVRLGHRFVAWRITPPVDKADTLQTPNLMQISLGSDGSVLQSSESAKVLVDALTAGHLTTSDLVSGTLLDVNDAHYFCIEVSPRHFVFYQDIGGDTFPKADLDRIPVATLTLSFDGVVQTHNSLAQQILGGEPLKGRAISAFTEGLGRPVQAWLDEAAAGNNVNKSEFLSLSRASRETFVQVSLTLALGQQSLIAVLTDATELKTLERQFVQSQKMQAIGQLAGGVAHDFNNLLTAISGHCDLLLLRHDQGDPDYADLIQINQNANRAAALVGQLLAFSRKQNLNPERIDLRSTLSDLAHLLNRLVGEKISLTLHHAPSMPAIRADKRQLEQVMMNLVVNARDAMPDGGEIVVRSERQDIVEPLSNGRITVPPGVYARVSVSDQGVGISPEMQQSIFEPFVTTKRTGEGTGLGLSTVYGIVKQTGGFIFVDSDLGKGSTFSLLFRLCEDHHQPQSLPAVATAEVSTEISGGVVLLVEDEAPVRAFASRALRLRGFTVIEADSGEAALSALDDGALEVDVVVTDVIMPGLDGPSWVRKALVDRPWLKVIFVSGYPEDVFERGDAEIPNSLFLPKPFSLKELTSTVASKVAE